MAKKRMGKGLGALIPTALEESILQEKKEESVKPEPEVKQEQGFDL